MLIMDYNCPAIGHVRLTVGQFFSSVNAGGALKDSWDVGHSSVTKKQSSLAAERDKAAYSFTSNYLCPFLLIFPETTFCFLNFWVPLLHV